MAKVYDPILCMMVEEKVSTKDSTLGSVEEYYNKMVGKSKSEVEKIVASAKGNPNADLAYQKWKATYKDECPEGMTCDKRSVDEAIRMCDSEQYYEFKLTGGATYYGTENDFREFMSHLTTKEKEEYGKLAYKSPKTKEYVENWRNKAMSKLGI